MSERKKYIMQISPGDSDFGKFDQFEGHEGEEYTWDLLDEEFKAQTLCRVLLSKTPKEGYDDLILEGIGIERIEGKWYVKILERIGEDEEEDVTVFRSAKPSERRGYMLRSMAEEQKTERKKDIMTTELDKRKKRKKQLMEEALKKKRR